MLPQLTLKEIQLKSKNSSPEIKKRILPELKNSTAELKDRMITLEVKEI